MTTAIIIFTFLSVSIMFWGGVLKFEEGMIFGLGMMVPTFVFLLIHLTTV